MDQSFHITNPDISEADKVRLRKDILRSLRPNYKFDQIFEANFDQEVVGKKNCENLLGSIELPIGVAGPVEVNWMGENLSKNISSEAILLPLATTEGALVASINRGCKVINQSQGAKIWVKKVGMSRAPVWRCTDGNQARDFLDWLNHNLSRFVQSCESTSNHLRFLNHQSWIRGRDVFVRFVFDTDQAMGMNMVTIAIQHAWDEIKSEHPEVELISLSSNVCTDKKDSVINRLFGRGYDVQAEIIIPEQVVNQTLKTSPNQLVDAHIAKNLIGSNIAGSFSQNMQIANVVAAMYLATGQDAAHIIEGSQASTTVEIDKNSLYVSVNLPNINVGTVGGGTWLPAQSQARDMIRQQQKLSTHHLAGAVGIAALAGEISGLAALAACSLASAHQKLGRVEKNTNK